MPSGRSDPREVVFLGATRTPFGSFGGSLKRFSATGLAVLSGTAAVSWEAGLLKSLRGQGTKSECSS